MTSPTASTAPTYCALALLLTAAALAGCGQKGALYQPEPTRIELGSEDEAESENGEDDNDGARP